MSDWTDEVRDRLLAPSTVSGTWGAPEDGPWCVKREADIRAALGEIERLTCAATGLKQCCEEQRAEAERLREALGELVDREELNLKHAYTTCDFGDSTNADRGCIWCVARAALRGGGE